MDRKTIDPGFASIVRPEDYAHETVFIEGAQVGAAMAANLLAEGSGTIPSPGLRIHASDLEQRDHRVVVGLTQRTDLNRQSHASRETRCRVGCTKCARASRGSSSRRNGGISAKDGSPARGRSRMRMSGSLLGTYPAVSGAGNAEVQST